MPAMKPLSLRMQLALVGAGYALVLVVAAGMVMARYLQYRLHPEEVSGGMYAFGDIMLVIVIGCMLLVPTFFLALVARSSERLFDGYSMFMLALSLTAPLSVGVLSIPAVNQSGMLLGWLCLARLLCSPLLVVAFAASRLLARFPRAKRLTLLALLIEALTLILSVVLYLYPVGAHQG